MVKAIFLDIDGTLRDERRGVPKSAVRAIRMCREAGIRIVICTGRNMASIQPDVKAMETDAVIAGGGCLILDRGRVQENLYFQHGEMKKILEYLTREAVPFALETQERIFMNQAACLWFQRDFETKLAGLEPWEKERQRKANGICYRPERDRIHKVCIWSPLEDSERISALAAGTGNIVQQGERDGWWYLELLPPGCTKGTAIRAWCGMRHINPADTLSFGDGKNDIDMLMATGTGVAMADGDEELKACADMVDMLDAKMFSLNEAITAFAKEQRRDRQQEEDAK